MPRLACTGSITLLACVLSAVCFVVPEASRAGDIVVSEEASPFPDFGPAWELRRLRNSACGPLSLIAILKRMDVSLSPQQTRDLLSAAGPAGTSLKQLQDLARDRGVHGLGAQLSVRQLKETGLFAIAHIRGNHFVAVVGYSQGGVQIVPPLRPPILIEDDRFQQLFGKSGTVLLLAAVPISPEQLGLEVPAPDGDGTGSGPSLSYSASETMIGVTHLPRWKKTVTLHNGGTEALEIYNVKASCASTSVDIQRRSIPPGETALLAVEGRTNGLGSVGCQVFLTTNQPSEPLVRLTFRGYYEPAVRVNPPCLTFPRVLAGRPAESRVSLSIAPDCDPNQVVAFIPEGAPP